MSMFPVGSLISMPPVSKGVVMTKIISNTNAKSSSGVMLISLSVTSELRCEKRRMVGGYLSSRYSVSILETSSCAKLSSSTVRTRRLCTSQL